MGESARAVSAGAGRRSRHAVALACALSVLGLVAALPARAQTLRDEFSITNGQVSAQVVRGNVLYVGGSFSFVGPITGAGVPVDASSGLAAPDYPRVNGTVLAAVPDGSGGWFLGGTFTTVGSEARSNLAHVLADQSVSPWNPGAGNTVRTLLLRAGVLYVGGDFLSLGGLTRNRIGAVDAATGVTTSWNPNANSSVRALVAGASVLYAGGQFTTIGGQARNRLAALSYGTGASDPAWNPNANSLVLALWLDSSTLYVGGQFTTIDGQARNRIAALDAVTGFATAWNPNANNQVLALVSDGATVYAGGQFTTIGGQSRNRIAALSAATGLATGWNANAGNLVQTLVLAGSELFAGGDFLSIGGQSRSRVAALSTASALATAWNPTAFGTVSVLAAAGGSVFVGGSFNGLGGVARNNLAAIDITTGEVTAWDPNANNQVQALAVTPDRLYVGGNFTQVGGQIRNNVAALDLTNGSAQAWDPNPDGQVSAIALSGSTVYVGGLFNTVHGEPHVNLAAVDANSALPLPWTVDTDNQVLALDASTANLYVGGNFTLLAGNTRNFLGSVDGVSGALTSWDPNANGTVRSVVLTCDRAYVGGFFTTIGGQARNRVAALDLALGQALAWDPNANGPVFALQPAPGVVYLGGVLSAVGGNTRNRVAAVDPVSGALTPWNPNSNGTVRALTSDAANVFVGGAFTMMSGLPSGNLAVVSPDASGGCPVISLPAPPIAAGVAGSAYSVSLAASGGSGSYCYALTAGALPAGLVLDRASGLVSGTPAAAGLAVFTVTATDVRGCSGSGTYTLAVTAAPAVNSVRPVTTNLCLNPSQTCVSMPFVLTRGDATGLRAVSVTLQLESARLKLCSPSAPANAHLGDWASTFSNRSLQVTDLGGGRYTVDVLILGQPCGATGGGTLFTLDVAAQGPLGSGTVSVTGVSARDCANVPVAVSAGSPGAVNISGSAITLSPATLPGATTGASALATITASGGSGPYTFSLASGTLPTGVTLSASGVLSGVYAATGTFAFTVRATESGGCSGTQAYSVSVTCPPLTVTPAFLPDGAVGVPYSATLGATGAFAPSTFVLTAGTLPPGLTLSPSGVLSGSPTAAASAVVEIGVTDAAGCTSSRNYTFDVFATPPVSTVAAVSGGLAISSAHPCVSVPFVYARGESAPARALSVSFNIDPAKLALCGTPGASFHLGSWFTGFANSHLQVTDDGGGAWTVDVSLLGTPCGITTGGTLFTVDLAAADGDGTGAITVTRVKARDCDNQAIGVIAGSPASQRVQTTNLALAPTTLPNAVVGAPYSQAITASLGVAPYTFSLASGALPAGLTLASDGTLSGTPNATGAFSFTVAASDAGEVPGSRAYTLNAACPVITLTPATLPDAQLGSPYVQSFVANGAIGAAFFSVTTGALPPGLTLSSGGELSGTPTQTGVFVFTVSAADDFDCVGSEVYTLPVFLDPAISRVFPVTAGVCLSANRTCVNVPFVYQRGDSAPARAAHVTFLLDPRFALCTPGNPAASIHPGGWLAAFGSPTFQVVDNGGGSYTVDQSLLGPSCGPTTGGVLFTMDVATVAGDGAGDLTVTEVRVRDCDNAPLPAQPGPAAQLVVSHTPPPAIDDLASAQVTSGNAAGELTGIALTWTQPIPGEVALYRAPFGSYPEYDDTGGTLPDSALAPSAPWTLASAAAVSGFVDHPPVRGSWHYVAFLTDSCGNRSAVSNRTRGSLDYHLGDVSNGLVRGTGDNRVGVADVSLLGAHYGISGSTLVSEGVAYLDVGPTVDGLPTGRPATDDAIDFEDLMVFALNFQAVSAPQDAAQPAAPPAPSAKGESFELETPVLVQPGDEVVATLHQVAGGQLQGFAAQLAWDASVVRPVSVTSGGFLERQGGLVLSPRPGAADAAVLGVRPAGISGAGDVATFTFEVLREGDAAIRIASVLARDAANRTVDPAAFSRSVVASLPAHTLMLAPAPNPARGATTLTFALATAGTAEMALYSVDGRRVRTLAHGSRAAGTYRITWKGDDDGGRPVAPGMYWARLKTPGHEFTRRIVFLR